MASGKHDADSASALPGNHSVAMLAEMDDRMGIKFMPQPEIERQIMMRGGRSGEW